MAIVATSREGNDTRNIVASYKDSYGVSSVEDTNRNPQATGRPGEEKFTRNALGELVPESSQLLADTGRGLMKGFADVGESITSGFGAYENPVSKEFLDASQYWADEQIRPEAASVGEGIADELTGGLIGGSVGKLIGEVPEAYQAAKRYARGKQVSKVGDKIYNLRDKAGVLEDAIPKVYTVGKEAELMRPATKLRNKADLLEKGITSTTTPPMNPIAKLISPAVPGLSKLYSKYVGKITDKGASVVSGSAAMRDKNRIINSIIDELRTTERGSRMSNTERMNEAQSIFSQRIESMLNKVNEAKGAGKATGTAIGALVGANQ